MPADAIAWQARVERVVYTGARLEVQLTLADGSSAMAEATNDGSTSFTAGQTVTLWFRPDDAWVIRESA